MRSRLFILILFIMLFLPMANALCPEIILSKTSFLPGETLQAEINGNFLRNIISNDISVIRKKDNTKLPLDIFITKISNQKFFVFFDLPAISIDVSEDYLIKVGALCKEGYRVRSHDFEIKKPIHEYYQDLKDEIKYVWPYLSTPEHASCLMAFAHDSEMYLSGKTHLARRNCPQECNIFENALIAIATKEDKFTDWLKENKNEEGNKTCWGFPCRADYTAFTLLAFKILGQEIDESAVAWLQENGSIGIEEKAILIYLTQTDYYETISSQSADGYWLKEGKKDISSTALAAFALESVVDEINESDKEAAENSIAKAKEWLLDNFKDADSKEKAFILFFAFPAKNIEAIMSVWPAVAKTDSPGLFSLILQNKGKNDIIINIKVTGTDLAVELPENSLKQIQFSIPLMTTPDARALFEKIDLDYENEYGYISSFHVPLIIFTQKGEEKTGGIETSESGISEEESGEIKYEQNQSEKTAEEEQELLKTPLKFDEIEISKDMDIGESVKVTLTLTNKLDQELKNIRIQKSSTLINIVTNIEPEFIGTLETKESKKIEVTIAPEREGIFEGAIDASVKINDIRYTNSVPFTVRVGPVITNVTKTCAEMGGRECEESEICTVITVQTKDTFRCCIPEANCQKKKEKKISILGIILFAVVVAALIIILIIITRKKKKQMSEILEETRKKYEAKFQRGFPR